MNWLAHVLGLDNASGHWYLFMRDIAIGFTHDQGQIRDDRRASRSRQQAGQGTNARSMGAPPAEGRHGNLLLGLPSARSYRPRPGRRPALHQVRPTSNALGTHSRHRHGRSDELPGNVSALSLDLRRYGRKDHRFSWAQAEINRGGENVGEAYTGRAGRYRRQGCGDKKAQPCTG